MPRLPIVRSASAATVRTLVEPGLTVERHRLLEADRGAPQISIVIFQSKTIPEFWDRYNDLPEDIQQRADKQFSLFARNPKHPSIQLKPAGEFWSARVTDAYRALAIREESVFTWFWIGPHDEYERLIK